MKRNFLSLAVAVIVILVMTSCSHTLYSPDTMEYHYNRRMTNKKELTAKAQVRIFTSEKDVKGEYTIISMNTYNPFRIPIFMSFKNQMTKKFYQKAVLKAQEQGGNGIIITSAGIYKVINITAWDADSEGPAIYVNAILDKTLMNKFANGDVAKSKKADIKRYESQFGEEITENIKTAKTLEEIDAIKEKIATYKNYNTSLNKPKSSISKLIEKQEKSLVKVEKKVRKKLAKNK